MMRDLKMQMEEQRAKKAAALQAKKDEEAREEERLQRERDELQRKFAQEADSKKKKFDEIREANAMIMQGKVVNTPPQT
jgi:hypothetical protein